MKKTKRPFIKYDPQPLDEQEAWKIDYIERVERSPLFTLMLIVGGLFILGIIAIVLLITLIYVKTISA